MKFPKKPGIYLFINKINGKVYIGKANNLHNRLSVSYPYYERATLKKTSQIILAIKKYGLKNFEIKILDILSFSFSKYDILDLESAWIKFYNATDKNIGYNCAHYSNDCTGIKMSSEARQKMSEAYQNRPETYKQQIVEKWKKSNKDNFRRVKQINSTTNEIIKVWNSIIEAAKFLGNSKISSEITNICRKNKKGRGIPKTAGGFRWQYLEDNSELAPLRVKKVKILKPPQNKRIKQIHPETLEIVKIWDSLRAASREFGVSTRRTINRILKSNYPNKIYKGFIWEYA